MTATALPVSVPASLTAARPALRAVAPMPLGFAERAASVGVSVSDVLEHGDLRVDLSSYEVTVGEDLVDASARQVELLALFLAAPRKVWSRDQLHWVCWGDTAPSRRVDVQLCRLRGKTGLDLFRNVRDRGWALRPL
jgi:DNA-binding response OmpR family regulator